VRWFAASPKSPKIAIEVVKTAYNYGGINSNN
jgi:hypothetical protein